MNYWAQKRVLVTGATGFLGSWMTAALLDRGATVVALVRDLNPQSDKADGVARARCTAALGRLEDFEGLLRVVNEHEIDTVFHLGAQAIVGTANRSPLSTFEANVRGTWNLLEACRQAGTVKRIVVASSDKAYGSQPVLPYTEEMPLQGCHPYDVSKSCTDLIAHTYYVTYKLPVCITRCGNFFGGRDMNFNRIVPDTIRSVVFDKAPVLRSDGTFIRDYIYVKDVVNAYMVLAEKMDRLDIHGQAFNFSNEDKLTVLDLTSKILHLMDRSDLEPVILNQTQGEIRDQHLSAAKARKVLDWKPVYTIDEALLETIEWYRGYFAEVGAALTSPAVN